MKRAIVFLGLSCVIVGCGKSESPAVATASIDKPSVDEAKSCISEYLSERGLKNVEFLSMTEKAELPKSATPGKNWAFEFSASFVNVFGERQVRENCVAVLAKADGKPSVTGCTDKNDKPIGAIDESSGGIIQAGGQLPVGELPPIIEPKP